MITVEAIRLARLEYDSVPMPIYIVYCKKAMSYIAENIKENMSTNDVASYLGISTGYLCKLFKNVTGKTVVEYINKNYYPVKFNAEQKEAVTFKGQQFVSTDPSKPKSPHQLALALLKQEMRYPSYVILDGESEWLYKLKGYKTAEDLLPILKYYGSDQYKVMSWSEFNELKSL